MLIYVPVFGRLPQRTHGEVKALGTLTLLSSVGLTQTEGSPQMRLFPRTGTYCFPVGCVYIQGSPGGSEGEESACNVGHLGFIPGSGRSPGEGTGYPLQYSCLENPMDRGTGRATVYGVAESQTRLSD